MTQESSFEDWELDPHFSSTMSRIETVPLNLAFGLGALSHYVRDKVTNYRQDDHSRQYHRKFYTFSGMVAGAVILGLTAGVGTTYGLMTFLDKISR